MYTNKTIKLLRSFFQKTTRWRHSPSYLYKYQTDKLRLNLVDWVILPPLRHFLTGNQTGPQKLMVLNSSIVLRSKPWNFNPFALAPKHSAPNTGTNHVTRTCNLEITRNRCHHDANFLSDPFSLSKKVSCSRRSLASFAQKSLSPSDSFFRISEASFTFFCFS